VKYPGVSQSRNSVPWRWTAVFEAFNSRDDYPLWDVDGNRAHSTPAGTYRFSVSGVARKGGAETPYRLASREFTVAPWSGLTAGDPRAGAEGISFAVGPVTQRPLGDANGPKVPIGPIDYPDSYEKTAGENGLRYIRLQHQFLRDPADQGNPSLFEWYCLTCTFRPWIDFGAADDATVTIASRGRNGKVQTDRRRAEIVADPSCAAGPAPGLPACERIALDRPLADGEAAYVCPGDLRDRFGNRNASRSAAAVSGDAPDPVCPD
jgi:hypothetical protein